MRQIEGTCRSQGQRSQTHLIERRRGREKMSLCPTSYSVIALRRTIIARLDLKESTGTRVLPALSDSSDFNRQVQCEHADEVRRADRST